MSVGAGDAIPTLDLGAVEAGGGAARETFGNALRRYGFCALTGHGVPPTIVDAAYAVFRDLFDLPEPIKRRYRVEGSGGARGFTPFKVETARDSTRADLKEFWHVGREDADPDPRMPANVWPIEVEAFRAAALALYAALDALGARVLRLIARELELGPDWFAPHVAQGNSILRAIHYPPVAASDAAQAHLRSAAHEDINLITLLVGASQAGLEVQDRGGCWLPLQPAAGAIVLNVGDMLQRLTAGALPSARHRVVNPAGPAGQRPRYSAPFFLHPHPDFVIRALPSCMRAGFEPQPPITAHQFLQERLREIRLL